MEDKAQQQEKEVAVPESRKEAGPGCRTSGAPVMTHFLHQGPTSERPNNLPEQRRSKYSKAQAWGRP